MIIIATQDFKAFYSFKAHPLIQSYQKAQGLQISLPLSTHGLCKWRCHNSPIIGKHNSYLIYIVYLQDNSNSSWRAYSFIPASFSLFSSIIYTLCIEYLFELKNLLLFQTQNHTIIFVQILKYQNLQDRISPATLMDQHHHINRVRRHTLLMLRKLLPIHPPLHYVILQLIRNLKVILRRNKLQFLL